MAINKTLYRLLRSGGVTGRAALALADDASPFSIESPNKPTAVTNAPALASTAVAAADAPAISAAYVQAEVAAIATVANETKADFNALRADLEATRTRLNALLAELR